MTTTERVLNILTNEGHYRPLPKPLKVGTQMFDFTHALAGSNKANDLVIVIELTGATDNSVVIRSVLAFTRALDVLGSRRSVTAVLTSGQTDKDLLNSINRVCRVLPIGSPTGEDANEIVRDWLAVLLPLRSPPPVEHLADWRAGLSAHLAAQPAGSAAAVLVSLAETGKDAIEDELATRIAKLADEALEENGSVEWHHV